MRYSATQYKKLVKLKAQGRSFTLTKSNALVYDSKEGVGVELNVRAKDKNDESIVCRHLAGYLLSLNPPLKNYHRNFSSIDKIQSVPYLWNAIYDKENINPKFEHVVVAPLATFGKALCDIAKDLEVGQIAAFELRSEVHFMALSVQCKRVSESSKHYIIKFNDPNVTDKHRRVICSNLDEIQGLQITDLLKKDDVNYYFAKLQVVALLSRTKMTDKEEKCVTIYRGLDSSCILYFLFRYALAKTLKDNLQTLLKERSLDFKAILNLFGASDEKGRTGIFFALLNRRYPILLELTKFVLQSNIPGEDKERIFKKLEIENVLYDLVRDRQENYLREYLSLILASDLPTTYKKNLLQDNVSNHEGGLHNALLRGFFEIADIYMSAVMSAKFTPAKKQLLLTMNLLNGKTGLCRFLCNGEVEAVTFYSKKILKSNLNNVIKMMLLIARDNDKFTGLYMACFNNRIDTVMAFVGNILSFRLPERYQVELIEAEVKGTPGFHMAFSQGHIKIIEDLTSLILSSNLCDKNKVRLLSATNASGVTGLKVAICSGHMDVATAFKEQVLASELNICDKNELIKPLLTAELDSHLEKGINKLNMLC